MHCWKHSCYLGISSGDANRSSLPMENKHLLVNLLLYEQRGWQVNVALFCNTLRDN